MVGIMSDSHDNLDRVQRAVGLFNDAGCDLVVHAGDIIAPFTVAKLRGLRCPVKAVYGNCDGEKAGLAQAFEGWGEIHEAPFSFSHAGRRFLLTHLDGPVDRYLASTPCDILVYGHTHKALVQDRNGILLVNPGETGGWLYGKTTVALLDPAAMTAEIVSLE
jgi:putative phosphoesterase